MAEEKTEDKKKNPIVEFLELIVTVGVIVFVVKSLVMEPFRIPSQSMDPTLTVGDYIITTKFSYGYGRNTFMFDLPLIQDRMLWNEPKRGDVAVFAHPQEGYRIIKRVVGVPGDVIELRNSELYINGQQARRSDQEPAQSDADNEWRGSFFEETFVRQDGSTHQHRIWDKYNYVDPDFCAANASVCLLRTGTDDFGPFEVPEDHVFFLGDNRDSSGDSRFRLGAVHRRHLIGKAQFVLFSFRIQMPQNSNSLRMNWVNPFRWDRFFKGVR